MGKRRGKKTQNAYTRSVWKQVERDVRREGLASQERQFQDLLAHSASVAGNTLNCNSFEPLAQPMAEQDTSPTEQQGMLNQNQPAIMSEGLIEQPQVMGPSTTQAQSAVGIPIPEEEETKRSSTHCCHRVSLQTKRSTTFSKDSRRQQQFNRLSLSCHQSTCH